MSLLKFEKEQRMVHCWHHRFQRIFQYETHFQVAGDCEGLRQRAAADGAVHGALVSTDAFKVLHSDKRNFILFSK